jgi:hypothetical protein
MFLSIPRSARFMTALFLAIPLLHADDVAKEKLQYVKPQGVTANVRQEAKPQRGVKNSLIPDDLALVVLCPEHCGLTVQEHPSVFWYMNKAVKGVKYVITITKEDEPEPLLERQLDPEKNTGIQRIDLKDIDRTLVPNADYKVAVAIIADPNDRSKDLVTTGMIKRIPAPEKLVSKLLTRATPGERAIVYARQGIWYDALAAISDQIASDPTNKELHQERSELFASVGLLYVAKFDQGQ